ncbi:MAG: glycosyltransferase [Candidatus Gastranaerophilaceae bacterium]
MKLFKKIRKENKINYLFLSIPLFEKVFSKDKVEVFFRGIRVYQKKINIDFRPKLNINAKEITLWVDHFAGGGAEFYFKNKLNELDEKDFVLRLQPIELGFYKFSIYGKNIQTQMTFKTLEEVKTFLSELEKFDVVVNNLCGYPDIGAVFDFIRGLKNKNKITMMLHDYYSVCPGIFLLNEKTEFCNIPAAEKCRECFSKNPNIAPIFKKQFADIHSWRNMWSDFYTNCTNEIIVFSESSRNILKKAYPHLESKMKIEPHKILEFKKIKKTLQKEKKEVINIAVLGNANAIYKGKKIITRMASLIKEKGIKDVKITVIGEYEGKNDVTATGKYDREDLPELLTAHGADIVFVPSVCPETYSYTTSEAMTLGMPVACFDVGASPERVKKYEKGLVISKIDAQTALDEITDFVKQSCLKSPPSRRPET